jgi:peptidoglycan/LPS O-acetylase OafA/YrhL
MQSRNADYSPEVDHLRLVAAAIVFTFHYFHTFYGGWQAGVAPRWFALVSEGYTGVSLFFVLSGYIFMVIGRKAGGAVPYGPFLLNRVLRIAPLHLTIVLLAFSIHRDVFAPADLLYAFVTNIGTPPTSRHFITGAAWSISVEFLFYLIFPFLLRFSADPWFLWRLILIVLAARWGAFVVSERPTLMIYSTVIGRLDQFLIGMIAATLAPSLAARGRGAAFALAAGAAAALLLALGWQSVHASFLAPPAKNPIWILWPTIEALLWSALILGYAAWRPRWPARLGPALATAGSWSFSLYMWHALVIVLVQASLPSPVGGSIIWIGAHAALTAAITLAFGALSFRTIEKPFLDMRRSYGA